jgi:hypothetical protein
MNLSRNALTAGIAALSLAASASPALAQGGTGGGGGGGDINNTVIQIAPDLVPAPTSGSGGGGGGKSTKCTSVLVDPVTMTFIGTCTTNRV